MRTRMPAHPDRNRRCRSDQRSNVRRARAVLPPHDCTASAETCSQNARLLQRTTNDASNGQQVMPRRTRNDVAIASTSPHVRGHPKRGHTTWRFSKQAEACSRRRRIARPGPRALTRSLLRASSRQELQAPRDDHGPEGPRHRRHAQRVGSQTTNPDAPKPRSLGDLNTSATPRHTSRQTEACHPARSDASGPPRCCHRRGVSETRARQRKPRPGVAVTRAVPGDQCGRSNQPKPIQPAT
jgi:hypothetical protein